MSNYTHHSALFLGATTALVQFVQPQASLALSPTEIKNVAEQFTVAIEKNNQQHGTGFIIGRDESSQIYYVLTVRHNIFNSLGRIDSNATFQAVTHDRTRHRLELDQKIVEFPDNIDLVILQFKSSTIYKSANLEISRNLQPEVTSPVFILGWPLFSYETSNQNPAPEFTTGVITSLQDLPKGYRMRYDALTQGGMSGSPILNSEGQVIGIHGQADRATLQQEITVKTFSRGIPINVFFTAAPRAYLRYAEESFKAGDFQGAIATLNQSLKFNHQAPETYLSLGFAHFAQKQYQEALKMLNQALRLNSASAEVYLLRGAIHFQNKNDQQALADLQQAIEKRTQFLADAHGLRGMIYARQNQGAEAFQAETEALKDPIRGRIYSCQIGSILKDPIRIQERCTSNQPINENASSFPNKYQLALNQGLDLPKPQPLASTPPVSSQRTLPQTPPTPAPTPSNRPSTPSTPPSQGSPNPDAIRFLVRACATYARDPKPHQTEALRWLQTQTNPASLEHFRWLWTKNIHNREPVDLVRMCASYTGKPQQEDALEFLRTRSLRSSSTMDEFIRRWRQQQ